MKRLLISITTSMLMIMPLMAQHNHHTEDGMECCKDEGKNECMMGDHKSTHTCCMGMTHHHNKDAFKARNGEWTTDFALFANGILSDQSPVTLNNGGVTGRYFLTDQWALRTSLMIQSASSRETRTFDEPYDEFDESKLTTKMTNSIIQWSLGAEHHFNGTNRLSPYIGADVALLLERMSQKTSTTDPDTNRSSIHKGPNTLGVGGYLFLGADYYLAKHIYLGIEGGLGIVYAHTFKDSETTNIGENSKKVEGNNTKSVGGLNSNARIGFKIGFVF